MNDDEAERASYSLLDLPHKYAPRTVHAHGFRNGLSRGRTELADALELAHERANAMQELSTECELLKLRVAELEEQIRIHDGKQIDD